VSCGARGLNQCGGDAPEAGFTVRAADGRCEPRPRAQVPRVGEPGDLAYLGDDQHRGVAPDTTNLGEDLNAVVGLRSLLDLLGRLGVSRSKSQISDIRLSSRRRGASRNCSWARNSRPPLPNRSECSRVTPCLARIACTRFLTWRRPRPSSPGLRRSPGCAVGERGGCHTRCPRVARRATPQP
jgi:hypothetical protein